MELPKIDALQSALASAGVTSTSATGSVNGPGSFLELLKRSLDQVNQTQQNAESLATQYHLNQNNVTLEDAMLASQKANISFQTAVQVRNRLISAYHDIMNMQI